MTAPESSRPTATRSLKHSPHLGTQPREDAIDLDAPDPRKALEDVTPRAEKKDD